MGFNIVLGKISAACLYQRHCSINVSSHWKLCDVLIFYYKLIYCLTENTWMQIEQQSCKYVENGVGWLYRQSRPSAFHTGFKILSSSWTDSFHVQCCYFVYLPALRMSLQKMWCVSGQSREKTSLNKLHIILILASLGAHSSLKDCRSLINDM